MDSASSACGIVCDGRGIESERSTTGIESIAKDGSAFAVGLVVRKGGAVDIEDGLSSSFAVGKDGTTPVSLVPSEGAVVEGESAGAATESGIEVNGTAAVSWEGVRITSVSYTHLTLPTTPYV